MTKTVQVPETLLKKLSNAVQAFSELEDELEDFLFSSDPEFLEKMRRAQVSHRSGATRSLDDLKQELCIE